MTKIYPIIMCGGAGTRLWPLSVKGKPKQFHALVTDKSLLSETVARADHAGELNLASPGFVCALDSRGQVIADCQAAGHTPGRIILEPCARNTAPVTAIAALDMLERDPEGIILLLPADHHIADPAGFWDCVGKGVDAAKSGQIVTFGIQPTRPETGYGYIQAGAAQGETVSVKRFVEKPDISTANGYLASGDYFWNAGIFLFSAKTMVDAFKAHAPDILDSCKATLSKSENKVESLYLDAASFADVRSESIDYAIMEQAENITMVAPVDVGWTDIGSWQALSEHLSESGEPVTKGDVIALNCEGGYIRSDGPLIGAYGLNNMIIIATDEAVLVIPAEESQNVKALLTEIKSKS